MIQATTAAHAQPAELQTIIFTVSPTSGRAPLTVTFCASAGIAIDFGDRTSSGMGVAPSGVCPEGAASYVTHTYATAGSYQLHGSPCPSAHSAVCGGVAMLANAVRIIVTLPP
jgi:PKD repeat protein